MLEWWNLRIYINSKTTMQVQPHTFSEPDTEKMPNRAERRRAEREMRKREARVSEAHKRAKQKKLHGKK